MQQDITKTAARLLIGNRIRHLGAELLLIAPRTAAKQQVLEADSLIAVATQELHDGIRLMGVLSGLPDNAGKSLLGDPIWMRTVSDARLRIKMLGAHKVGEKLYRNDYSLLVSQIIMQLNKQTKGSSPWPLPAAITSTLTGKLLGTRTSKSAGSSSVTNPRHDCRGF